ncbi:phosphotransferase [Patulibacter brassicae]|uniref:Phosphotransferase n=1 Tax=Patulibacter brassicae TaxID=1705717 RepID=A0ABU4VEE9_9ACTN|nr:phosphotransferase [Patulibacter brassicae]MDX8150127.1 phosphotransferase [Patulibacter brassicae]
MRETLPLAIGRAAGRTTTTLAARARETVRRPVARTASDVPIDAAAITPEWLTAVLCARHAGTRVRSVSTTAATTQTTSRAALRLAYEGPAADELPTALFVKLTPDLRQRLFLGLIRIIDGEPEFYARLRPLADFECPLGYHGAHDRRSWASAVLIEDIAATRGASFCHATTDVDRPMIESLLETMAAYHGAYWQLPAVTDSTLKRPSDHLHNTSVFLNMRRQCLIGIERAGALAPSGFAERDAALWEGLQRSMATCSDATGPTTLLHGDPHVGNAYRTADGRMALTDWQVVMRGLWAYDVADALVSALAVDDRRAWERELLEHYLEHLARAGGQPPELERAWRLYRQCLLYPLYCWGTVLGAPSWMPETHPPDVAATIVGRAATAIDDLGSLATFR